MTLPRVSTILSLLYPNSLDFVKQEHLERGTDLHHAMEVWVNNILLAWPTQPQLPPRCQRVADWLVYHGIVFESTEEQYTHKYGFTGRPDLLAKWGKDEWVVDYKFAEQLTEQNEMQMEAYTRMTGRKGCFLQCPASGKVRAKRHKRNPALWNAFLAGLQVWKFRAARRPEKMSQAELEEQLTDIKEALCKPN